jgi:tetratricopeptide (TPR) repeat protein
MSDGNHRRPAVPLERPVRLRPSWARRLARLAVVVGLSVAIIGRGSDMLDRKPDCATAVHKGSRIAVQVCQLELERTKDPATGVLLAKALSAAGDLDGAKRTAAQWLTTPVRSDALQILGEIARAEGRNDDAMVALDRARALHLIELKPKQLARDDATLSMIRTDRSEFAEALRLVAECITVAERVEDTSLQVYCHLTAAKTLIRVGYWLATDHEIDLASLLAASDRERSDLEYQRGNFAQESGHHPLAVAHFRHALRLRQGAPDSLWILRTELTLAYSLAETGDIDEARLHLETARFLDFDHKLEAGRAWVAAQIAYRAHDLSRAASLTEKYFQLLDDDDPDHDDQLDVVILRTQIELERGELEHAEDWAKRGIEQAEAIRGKQSVELRSWFLTKRRAPYELLFTALARNSRVEDAAMAFDQWQGRTVQDALATPPSPTSFDYRGIVDQVTRLGAWLPIVSEGALARPADRESVLRTMLDIDLLALIVADGEVWQLTAHHGPLRLSKLGAFADIKYLVAKFSGHAATDTDLASSLGTWLLPDDAFRKTNEVLHVLIDGQLGGLPVAALRRGTTPLIAMRPIVRVLRLPETRCVHVHRPGPATVLAAPDSRILNVVVEAVRVAGLLHTTSAIGRQATKAALFHAAGDGVLHVASHGKIGMDGASLVLGDGEVSALEISASRRAPSLVVLSACDTAASDESDAELARSLASGFLGAGSQHVVATLRPVTDSGALEISTQFYREGGVADPARALAAVQTALVGTSNHDWPYFVVFGPDVCREDSPTR